MCRPIWLLQITRAFAFIGIIVAITSMVLLLGEFEKHRHGEIFALFMGVGIDDFDVQTSYRDAKYLAAKYNITLDLDVLFGTPEIFRFVLGCVMLAFLELITNMMLYIATMTMQRWLTSPLFFSKSIIVVMQFSGLLIYVSTQEELQIMVILKGVAHIVSTVVVAATVFASQLSWPIEDPYFGRWETDDYDDDDDDED